MIKIDHLALYVNDLKTVKEFFIKYFNAKSNELYINPVKGNRSYFLRFGNDVQLEIINKPEIEHLERNFQETGYHHLAFNVGGKDNVDKLTLRMQNDGYKKISGPRLTGDGYYESCICGPEDILIEITE